MASTLESEPRFSARDNHTNALDQTGSLQTRPNPPASGTALSSWSNINNIWKTDGFHGGRHDTGTINKTHGKSEKAVESESGLTYQPVSPDRHDSLSRLRMPRSNGTTTPREQESLSNSNLTYRRFPPSLPPVTLSNTRATAPSISPSRARTQELPVLPAGPFMPLLSNATLLSGSAPDIEPMPVTSGHTRRLPEENKLRSLNIAGVHDFVPAFQRDRNGNRSTFGFASQSNVAEAKWQPNSALYSSNQGFIPTRTHGSQMLDHCQGRFDDNGTYYSGRTRNFNDTSDPGPNVIGGEYGCVHSRTTNVLNGNHTAPGTPADQRELRAHQQHVEIHDRISTSFDSSHGNGYSVPDPRLNNGSANLQTYDYQYHAHMNRNTYLVNRDISPYTTHEFRNGTYTPTFTPPSAPESQRSTSGSGPSTGASSQPIEPRARIAESNQIHVSGRTGLNQGYATQTPRGYFQGYQQSAAYTDAYTANGMNNAMGPTAQELCEQRADPEKPISPFLKEFKANCKTKRYELKDVYGYIVEFSGDQHGSRFIQGKLETANSDEKEQVFMEIQENALQLMTDIFGNYVIQKLFEHGTQAQKKVLANQMKGRVLYLTTQVYGCRVVQKALEHVLTDQQAAMVKELDGHILPIVENQNGNHVIQKAIERVPGEHIHFIVEALRGQIIHLARHNYGCRVVQRMLEYGQPLVKRSILAELHTQVHTLIPDTFGNYVVQHIIRHGEPADRSRVVALVQQQLLYYSKHKFASNVVEAAIESSEAGQREEILHGLTGANIHGQSPVYNLIRDQYGNYVIQKVLQRLTGPAKDNLIRELRYCIDALPPVSNGKQVSAIEKAIAEATDGSSQPSPSRPSHNGGNAKHHVAGPHYYNSRMQYPTTAYSRMATDGGRP